MATYTVANGGGNINAAATFVGGVGIPGAADTIDFTGTSGQLTVNVATTILDINFSGYTNVITFNNNLSVSRNIILNTTTSTYTTAGGLGIIKTGTGTITSNGKIWTSPFSLGSGTYTITFNDVMNVSGQFNCQLGGNVTLSSNNVLDPERLNIIGNCLTTSGTISGTCLVKFTGTNNQTWISNYPGFSMSNSIKVDKAGGTLTLSGAILLSGGTFTYVQGTVNSGTSTLWASGATFDTNGSSASGATKVSSTGINWSTVVIVGVLNISSNFTVIQQITANGGSITRTSTQNVYLGGDLLMSSTLSSTSTPIIINGTGTWSSGGLLSAPLTISTSGTITLGASLNFASRTLTYTAGTVVSTGNTLTCSASCTLATSGMTWNNITFSGASQTYTLSSNLNLSGTLTLNGTTAMTLTGSTINIGGGLTVGNTATTSGTTNIVFNGTGTWSHSTAGYIQNNITINTSGTLTLGANIYYRTGTLTYTLGTIDTSTNSTTLNIGGSCTLATNGISWVNLTTSVTATITLTNDLVWSNNWTATTGTIAFSGVGGNLAPSTTANLLFTGNPTITLKNNIQVTNVTLNGSVVNTNTISLSGNLSVLGSCSGTTSYIINGTGSQSWSSPAVVYLQSPLTINKPSGVLTLGAIVGMIANLTYISGDIDAVTNSNTFYTRGGTFNVGGMTFNNFTFATIGNDLITLASNLSIANNLVIGGGGTINGLFNIYCGNLNINNSTSGAGSSPVTFSGIFYCSNNCTFSGNTNATCSGTVYVNGSLYFNSSSGSFQGPAIAIMTGNGEISQLNSSVAINSNIYINTGGKIKFTNTLYFFNSKVVTLALQRGTVDARKCTLYIPTVSGTHNLTNMNKINFKIVYLPSGGNVSMNEFFNGSPQVRTHVLPTSTTNYTITFTDNFEKISKFVKLNNCTLSRRNQLLMLTNITDKRTNIGVRFFNTLPNGFSKNDPSVNQGMGYGANFITSDPCFN
jgi:hypothetical protein